MVNSAMDQTVQPVPSTFFPPKYRISAAPIMESTTVQRRQGRCPQVCLYSGVFVSGEVLLIGCPALLLPAKDPVGQGVDRPIHGSGVQGPGLLLEGRAGALDGPLHPFRQRVAPGRKAMDSSASRQSYHSSIPA